MIVMFCSIFTRFKVVSPFLLIYGSSRVLEIIVAIKVPMPIFILQYPVMIARSDFGTNSPINESPIGLTKISPIASNTKQPNIDQAGIFKFETSANPPKKIKNANKQHIKANTK